MKLINSSFLVALCLALFIANAIAHASPSPEFNVADEMTAQEVHQATEEWQAILDAIGSHDQVAGPGGRATVCSATGIASYYGGKFHGRRTASGEIYNKNGITAAHRSLPFGTRVRVTSQATGRSITVRINDRGPFIRGRIIDLSAAAARALGVTLGKVQISCL